MDAEKPETPTRRRPWIDTVPWWLWAAWAVTNALVIPGRLERFASAVSRDERTGEALTASQAAVWCLIASAFAVRAWRSRKS